MNDLIPDPPKFGAGEAPVLIKPFNAADKRRFRSRRNRFFKAINARRRVLPPNEEEHSPAVVTDLGLWMEAERFEAYFFPEWWGGPSNLGRTRRMSFLKSFKRDPLPTLLRFGFRHLKAHTKGSGSRQTGKGVTA